MFALRGRLSFVIAVSALGCAAFPDHLLERIPTADAGPATDGGSVSEGGALLCPGPACPTATLVIGDTGVHRALASVGDTIVWSSNLGRTEGFDVKYCRSADCATPALVKPIDCSGGGALAKLTGY